MSMNDSMSVQELAEEELRNQQWNDYYEAEATSREVSGE